MKILTIVGARPQFIKAGNISREILKYSEIKEIIVHTGQHFDNNMSEIFFEEMKIPKPNYYLGVGGRGRSHGSMTGEMIIKLEEIMNKEKPDVVLVYGDTNSTLAGAIAACKLHIPIAHIEAGLRSFNMKMPEEVNRILTDRVSKWLFCPTDIAVQNLKNEGYGSFDCKIVKSGDIMYDGAIFYKSYSKKPSCKIENNFILATIHRAENTDNEKRLKSIFEALNEIAKEQQIILPLHPRTKQRLFNIPANQLTIIDPVGYLEMIWLLDNCTLVMTDSGGLQKEAYFFKKPCITLRDETEWGELVEVGVNTLVGANKENIINAYKSTTNIPIINQLDLYGNGKASEIIVNELIK